MTSGHRHATDRKQAVVVGGCPNGCTEIEIETEGRDESVDQLIETVESKFGPCSECGGGIGLLHQEEPTEILE